MSGLDLASSIKHTGIEWIFGFGAIILTWEGIISFWLGFAVTVLTIYKILLDIKINRAMLRSQALSQVSKKVSAAMPEQKQHESEGIK